MSTSNITENVRALFADSTLLVRQEIALAKAEASEKLSEIQVGVTSIAAGALIAFVALMVLVQALVVVLTNFMPPSLASLLVGVVLAVVAFATVKSGQNKLAASSLKPERTIHSVQKTAENIREAA
ncbi:MAG: phage holin family protein [Pseudomonadota bacterium]